VFAFAQADGFGGPGGARAGFGALADTGGVRREKSRIFGGVSGGMNSRSASWNDGSSLEQLELLEAYEAYESVVVIEGGDMAGLSRWGYVFGKITGPLNFSLLYTPDFCTAWTHEGAWGFRGVEGNRDPWSHEFATTPGSPPCPAAAGP
jgi:hypothetical protein